MKVELVKGLDKDDIKKVWLTYMEDKGKISDVLNVIFVNINYF
jgi:hypothetical protein